MPSSWCWKHTYNIYTLDSPVMEIAVVGNKSKCQFQTMQMINGHLQSLGDTVSPWAKHHINTCQLWSFVSTELITRDASLWLQVFSDCPSRLVWDQDSDQIKNRERWQGKTVDALRLCEVTQCRVMCLSPSYTSLESNIYVMRLPLQPSLLVVSIGVWFASKCVHWTRFKD